MLAASYSRFSSDNQREESITAQQRAINDYSERQGVTILKEYVDEARSAMTDDRPQFQQMIDDITNERIKVDYVYVHKLDRFARNRYDSAVYRRALTQKGVRLISVTQPLDDSPESSILEAMLEAMAEYYSKNLGREAMKGLRENAYQGKHTGGTPPLGYSLDSEKKYIINPKEAEIVRIIFEMLASGEDKKSIINALNAKGYKTKAGNPFGLNSIHEILKNEKYKGTFVFNRTLRMLNGKRNHHANKPDNEIIKIDGMIPAIIDEELWGRVQKIMKIRKQTNPRKRSNVDYLLTSLTFCGLCGAPYVGNSKTGGRNKEKYHVYSCTTRKRTKECKGKDIRKEVLEKYVLEQIQNVFNGPMDKFAEDMVEQQRKLQSDAGRDREQLETSLKDVVTKKDLLIKAIESGVDPSTIASRLNSLEKEREVLEQSLIMLKKVAGSDLDKEYFLHWLEEKKNILIDFEDVAGCKKAIQTFVKRVTVCEDDIKVELMLDADNVGGGGAYLTISASENIKKLYDRERSNRVPDHKYDKQDK